MFQRKMTLKYKEKIDYFSQKIVVTWLFLIKINSNLKIL